MVIRWLERSECSDIAEILQMNDSALIPGHRSVVVVACFEQQNTIAEPLQNWEEKPEGVSAQNLTSRNI